MPIIEYLVGLGSGVLFSVVSLYFTGGKTVSDKKSNCDEKLVATVISLAPSVAKNKVEDADKQ